MSGSFRLIFYLNNKAITFRPRLDLWVIARYLSRHYWKDSKDLSVSRLAGKIISNKNQRPIYR